MGIILEERFHSLPLPINYFFVLKLMKHKSVLGVPGIPVRVRTHCSRYTPAFRIV